MEFPNYTANLVHYLYFKSILVDYVSSVKHLPPTIHNSVNLRDNENEP